jgi:hypothetical protein
MMQHSRFYHLRIVSGSDNGLSPQVTHDKNFSYKYIGT